MNKTKLFLIAALVGGLISPAFAGAVTVNRLQLITLYTKGEKVIGATNAPVTGYIGESIVARVASTSAVALTNGVATDIVGITVTPGTWTVSAVACVFATTNVTAVYAVTGVGTTSENSMAGVTFGDNGVFQNIAPTLNNTVTMVIPGYSVYVTSNTLLKLKVGASFTPGQLSAYGRISLRRER